MVSLGCRRLFLLLVSPIMIFLLCGLVYFWLNQNCPLSFFQNCYLLWGGAVGSILAGVFLLELLITRQKNQGEWRIDEADLWGDGKSALSSSYIWLRPIAWVALASLLAALPLIIQGAFAITVFGILIGIFIDSFVRAIMNWFPPTAK